MRKIEYIFSISSKCAVCKNKTKLRSFLSSSDLSLVQDNLSLENEHCKVQISEKKIKDSENVLFSLVFSSESETEPIKLLKTVRQAISNIKDENQDYVTVLELQNDYARERSEKIYPMIYAVENSMRKLLTRFMLETLGMKWYESAPEDVMKSVKGESKNQWGKDCLYHIDFIQLSYFLLLPYAKEKEIPWDTIKKALHSEISKEERECIENSIPINNWDRYFKKLVTWDSERFKLRWEELYKIRNTIAHNRLLKQIEYEKGVKSCKEIQKLLDEAIDKIDKVKISDQEKVNVVKTMDAIFPRSILESISNFQKIAESFKPITSVVESLRINPINDDLLKSVAKIKSSCSLNPITITQSESLLKSINKIQSNTTQIVERITPVISKDEIGKR